MTRRFAENLRHARLRLGLSQQELAERAGLSLKYVSYVETGARNPALDTALRLAHGLGTTVRDMGPEVTRVTDLIRRLGTSQRRKALALLRAAFGSKR